MQLMPRSWLVGNLALESGSPTGGDPARLATMTRDGPGSGKRITQTRNGGGSPTDMNTPRRYQTLAEASARLPTAVIHLMPMSSSTYHAK